MNLDELEKLAKEATPGPWKEISVEIGPRQSHCYECPVIAEIGVPQKPYSYAATYCDFEYMAAANPATVLKLIAVARAAGAFADGPCFCDDDQDGLCRQCRLDAALMQLNEGRTDEL